MNLRELIDEKILKLREVDSLSPQEIAQESIELSSLWASVNKEIIDRKMRYNSVLKNNLEQYGKAALAKIHSESTEEYRAWLEAEAYSKSVQELIRTTKRYVRLMEEEYRETQR